MLAQPGELVMGKVIGQQIGIAEIEKRIYRRRPHHSYLLH
jgi:hypothetical protein